MEDDDGGWTVVRGKGKAAKRSPLKRARDECCPGDGGPCAGAATADGAAAATHGPGSSGGGDGGGAAINPGWPAPNGDANRRPAKGNRRGFRERTPAEQCDALIDAVNACRREVEDSPFYASLLKVMRDASSRLTHLGFSNSGGAGGRGEGAMAAADSEVVEAEPGAGPGPQSAGARAGGAWQAVRRLVVYGLGSPHESRVSRYQLALVLLLRDQVLPGLQQAAGAAGAAAAGPGAADGPMVTCGAPSTEAAVQGVQHQDGAVQLYDPAFDDVDVMALGKLGLQVIAVNEGGARRVSEPTFFYLPHCEGVLCDALLGANWSDGQVGSSSSSNSSNSSCAGGGGGLPSVVILGNSFRTYQDRWELQSGGGSRTSKPDEGKPVRPSRIIRCCELGAVVELRTPDLRFPAPSAFNDMSLHLFPPGEALKTLLVATGEEGMQPEMEQQPEQGLRGGGGME
ncbi:hypothetical protein HYH02_010291 [Chlamydomonas schloesseri]|uniref:SRR1-like domain-containing protein n=1 Tax=Chlamydomonas schloesseri TaxID=2026947 RepID=A0A835TBZ1_9CHLO|nr:hypothetical protein HYH02_010291 [Chlamydomonas schloesseri]|eukprot:KAG2440403.1 hypothetical protein HYH02_010291 [Chlamydomonas schloesseri]